MSTIKLTVDGVYNGKQISFCALCRSEDTTGLTINNVEYDIVNAIGESVLGVYNVWATDSIVSVILNTDTNKAYIQNKHIPIRQICSLTEIGITEFPVTTLDVCEAIRSNVSEYFKLSCEVSKDEISDLPLPYSKGLLEITGSSLMSLTFSGKGYSTSSTTGITTVNSRSYESTFVITDDGIGAVSPWYTVFTQYNPPTPSDIGMLTGAYGGNGETSREIPLSRIAGSGIIIWCGFYKFAFCNNYGAYVATKQGDPTSTTISWKFYPNVKFSGGKITISAQSSDTYNDHGLNGASSTYYYQVIGMSPR